MNELIDNVISWAEHKNLVRYENRFAQACKFGEEGGELFAAVGRADKDKLKDSIGDTLVTLIILAAQHNMTTEECLACAWAEIKDRTGKMQDGVFVKSSDL